VDADATWAYRPLPSAGEWLTEVHTDLESYRATFTDPDRLAATVIVELDGIFIGEPMLRMEDNHAQAQAADQVGGRQAELGWVIHPAHSSRGYATDAVRSLLAHCFTFLGVHRVAANLSGGQAPESHATASSPSLLPIAALLAGGGCRGKGGPNAHRVGRSALPAAPRGRDSPRREAGSSSRWDVVWAP
jgi:hypothetical protein